MFGTFVADDAAITPTGSARPAGAVRERLPARADPRRVRPQDEQVASGNGIDPLDWVEKFGADALRFTLARGASPGGDLSIGEDHARASRNFATKLFNATKFALMNGAPGPAARRRRAHRRRPVDSRPAGRGSRRSGFGVRQLRVQPGLRGALPLRLGRVLRLVRRAGEGADRRRRRTAPPHHRGAGRRARHVAQAAAPGDAVRHRDAVEDADRRRVRRHRRLAAAVRIRGGSVAAQRIADMQKLVTEVRRFRSDQGLDDRQKVPARLSRSPTPTWTPRWPP